MKLYKRYWLKSWVKIVLPFYLFTFLPFYLYTFTRCFTRPAPDPELHSGGVWRTQP